MDSFLQELGKALGKKGERRFALEKGRHLGEVKQKQGSLGVGGCQEVVFY